MKRITPSSASPRNSQRPRHTTCAAATMQHHLPACAQLRRLTAAPAAAGRWAHARPELLGTRAVDQLALAQFNGAEAMV